jgi:hypothetical protein
MKRAYLIQKYFCIKVFELFSSFFVKIPRDFQLEYIDKYVHTYVYTHSGKLMLFLIINTGDNEKHKTKLL